VRRLAIAVLSLLPLAACFADKEIIDPKIDIPEKCKLIVVPFEDLGQNGFLSERGSSLSLLVAEALKAKAEFRILPKEKVLQLYDNDEDPRSFSAAKVAQRTGADYVLMGSITRWTLTEPKTFGLVRGDSTVEVTLYETSSAATERLGKVSKSDESQANLPLHKHKVSCFFPHEYGQPFGSDELDMTPEKVDAGLRARTAQEIAWLLLPHTKEEDHLANGR
jgi:hypothetical protein